MTGQGNRTGVVIFDGVCNLCNGAVNFIIRHDPEARFLFTPAQGELATKLTRQHNILESLDETFVLIQENQVYYRSDAALKIASQLTGGWRSLRFLQVFPAGLRDWTYTAIARRRYDWFGKREVCMIPTPDVAARFVS